jgi:hypothetical protein
MENLHILEIKLLEWTNTKPARIKLISHRFEQSIILSYTNNTGSYFPAIETALNYLEPKGFKFIGKAENKNGWFLVSTTFEPIKP